MTNSGPDLVFVPLGGLGEIGMNLALYGLGSGGRRKWLMVDCGVTFGDPAETPGIDLIYPDLEFVEKIRKDLVALVLTHGHEDHLGGVVALWPRLKVPVVATPFTAALVETKQASEPGSVKPQIRQVPVGGRIELGPFDVEFVPVAHSIPESHALAIRTTAGLVVHTGDWKFDPDPPIGRGTSREAFEALGREGVRAVVADSTNAIRDGRSPTERDVATSLAELIANAPGRVAVTTFASNVIRIRAVAEAALAADRHVVVVGRAMERVADIARELGYLDGLPEFLRPDAYGYLPKDKVVALLTGSQGEPRAALARIAQDDHPEIAVARGDRIIFSSRTIPGNEKGVNRIINGLVDRGCEIITDRTHLVHVSGHPRRDEMADLYRWLKPQVLVPAHGEALHLSEHAKLGRAIGIPEVVTARNGDMVRLGPGPATVTDRVPVGRMFKDGQVMVGGGEGVLAERRKLAFSGVVTVVVPLSEKGELIGDVEVRLVGVPTHDVEGEPMLEIIRDTVHEVLDNIPRARRRDPESVAETVRRALRAEIDQAWGKKPICQVIPVIL